MKRFFSILCAFILLFMITVLHTSALAAASISLEDAKKAVLTAIGNEFADDVYTSDGMDYDPKKFHPYGYYENIFTIVSEGDWTTTDDGKTWHVEGLTVQSIAYKGYRQYSFDIRFDGKKYYLENGQVDYAGELKWIENKDPSKWGMDDLSNLDFYKMLIVPVSLLK